MNAIKYHRPKMYGKQSEAIFHQNRIGIVEASTKSGKTYGGIAWLFEQALLTGAPGRHYWWVAPVYSQAKIAYNRLKRGLPSQLIECNETELTIKVFNGAIIQFKSGEKPDNLYGEDVWAAVIDEGPRMREESWWAVRSTLTATRGPVRILGNVRGRRNWVYKLARSKAKVTVAKITAWDAAEAGVINREEVLAAQAELPEHIFKELYEAEASDDGGNPFSLKHLEASTLDSAPLSIGPVAAWGIDLAKSTDWTVVIGLDDFGQVIHYDRFQDSWENTKERIVRTIGIGGRPAIVDATGVGDPIVESLQKAGCNVEGFVFTSTSKQILMEALRLRIQLGELSWWDEQLVDELESFEYYWTRTGVKYQAPVGGYDDSVDALALAAKCWHEHRGTFWPYENSSNTDVEVDSSRTNQFRHARRVNARRAGVGEMAGILGRDF